MTERFTADDSVAWFGPFAVFMAWLAVDSLLPVTNPTKEIVRDVVLLGALLFFSRRIIPRSAPHLVTSVLLGLAVFAIWISPDLAFPEWRSSPIFQNSLTGRLKTSIPPSELTPLMLAFRTARAVLLVPIIEELFWRGWLPRWLQDTKFANIPLGKYTAFTFWATAALFAAEHGPYWEVGLLCGVIYNSWMRRTGSLGDLVVAHAVTNLALSVYVINSGRWTFWM